MNLMQIPKTLTFVVMLFFTISGSFGQSQNNPGGSVPGTYNGGMVKDPLPMNGNNTLGMTFSQSSCGLNYVQVSQLIETRSQAAGINTNGTGLPTNLTISGIPSCPTILKAYVWYTVAYKEATPPATSVVIKGTTVPSTIVGTSGSKNWGETGTVVYRADVTANVTGNGIYSIDVTGGLTSKNTEVDGLTLFIIYKDNSATYQGSLVLWDGCWTVCSAAPPAPNIENQTMTGIAACGNSTFGKAFLIVSDMQGGTLFPPSHSSTLNGSTASYPNSFYNFDAVNTNVASGQSTASYGLKGGASNMYNDCFCWSVMGLYYQTTTCATCVPAALSVTVTSTNGSCGVSNGSAVATASGAPAPYTYSWNTGATTTSITNLSAGVYSVTVTDATGCSTAQSCSVTSSTGPGVTFATIDVKCNGGNTGSASLTPAGGQPPYTYAWVTTPVQTSSTANNLLAGTYSVVVSDASGCSATYTTSITEPTALAATASVVTNISCAGAGDGSAASGGSGGTGAYTYAWSPGGQNAQTATGLSAGPYSVTVSDANSCTASASVTITEPAPLALQSTIVNASCGLPNGTASVSVTGGTGPYTYLWLTTPVQTGPMISDLSSGGYNVVVTDAFGCAQQMAITIPTSVYPIAEFSNNPDTVDMINAEIYFTNLSQNATDYLWDFGDPNNPATSTEVDPIHVYSDTGTYCITLIANVPGAICTDTMIHCIRVEAPFCFYIPNTFTPNHDGANDFFYGKGREIKEYNIWIFDRWGNLIWDCHYTNSSKAWDAAGLDGMPAACIWDGNVAKGGPDMSGDSRKLVQEDVYMWKVKLTDTHDNQHNYIGNVNMVR